MEPLREYVVVPVDVGRAGGGVGGRGMPADATRAAAECPGAALLLINFAFLLLTFKARRFIEYWPPFCVLSAAYLSAPVLAGLPALIPTLRPGETLHRNWTAWPILGLVAACIGYLLW
jgi:hypothetical protein